jgi:hypothetical protein
MRHRGANLFRRGNVVAVVRSLHLIGVACCRRHGKPPPVVSRISPATLCSCAVYCCSQLHNRTIQA